MHGAEPSRAEQTIGGGTPRSNNLVADSKNSNASKQFKTNQGATVNCWVDFFDFECYSGVLEAIIMNC